MDNKYYEKPPLGLRPKKYWIKEVYSKRQLEILAAMERYTIAGKIIPVEWIAEYNNNNQILIREYDRIEISEKDIEEMKQLIKYSKIEVL